MLDLLMDVAAMGGAGGSGGGGGGGTPAPAAFVTFEVGNHATRWYSTSGGDSIGTLTAGAAGDFFAAGDLLDRVQWNGSVLQLNATGVDLAAWAGGDGAGRTLTVKTPAGDVALDVDDSAGNNATRLRWSPDAAAVAVFDTVAAG